MSYSVTVDPKARQWSQGLVALGLITGWAVFGLLCEGYLSYRQASWHPITVSSTSPDSVPGDPWLAILLLQIGWVLSLNLLVPAAVLGCRHLRRSRAAIARIGSLLVVIAAAGVGTVWSLQHAAAYGLVLIAICWLGSLALLRPPRAG